jgi:hypothetical protein
VFAEPASFSANVDVMVAFAAGWLRERRDLVASGVNAFRHSMAKLGLSL